MKMNLSSAVKMVYLVAITTILMNVEFLTVLLLLHLQVLLAYLVKLYVAMFV